MTKMFSALIFASALFSITSPALAAPRSDAVIVKRPVEYRASELSSPSGAKRIVRRIEAVATAECREPGSLFIFNRNDERICERDAASKAVASLHSRLAQAAFNAERSRWP